MCKTNLLMKFRWCVQNKPIDEVSLVCAEHFKLACQRSVCISGYKHWPRRCLTAWAKPNKKCWENRWWLNSVVDSPVCTDSHHWPTVITEADKNCACSAAWLETNGRSESPQCKSVPGDSTKCVSTLLTHGRIAVCFVTVFVFLFLSLHLFSAVYMILKQWTT